MAAVLVAFLLWRGWATEGPPGDGATPVPAPGATLEGLHPEPEAGSAPLPRVAVEQGGAPTEPMPTPDRPTGAETGAAAAAPARLSLRLLPGDGLTAELARLVLRRAADGRSWRLRVSGTGASQDGLLPGDYLLELSGAGLARGVSALQLGPGQDLELTLPLLRGQQQLFLLARGDGPLGCERALLSVRDTSGNVLLDAELRRLFLEVQPLVELPVWLAPGAYAAELLAEPSAVQRATFRLEPGEPAEPIRFNLP